MIEYHIFKVNKTKDNEEAEKTIHLSYLQYNLIIAMVDKWLCKEGVHIIPMVQAELIEEKLKELL